MAKRSDFNHRRHPRLNSDDNDFRLSSHRSRNRQPTFNPDDLRRQMFRYPDDLQAVRDRQEETDEQMIDRLAKEYYAQHYGGGGDQQFGGGGDANGWPAYDPKGKTHEKKKSDISTEDVHGGAIADKPMAPQMNQMASGMNFASVDVASAASDPVAASVSTDPASYPQIQSKDALSDIYFLLLVSASGLAGIVGLLFAAVCWYRLRKIAKEAGDADYPAYGTTGPNTKKVATTNGDGARSNGATSPFRNGGNPNAGGDRKLAQSAQMYHYQHQKQKMMALEKQPGDEMNENSDEESEEENDGDYTVYECPGLAPTGEMEVKNPLFSEENTPVSTPDHRFPPNDQVVLPPNSNRSLTPDLKIHAETSASASSSSGASTAASSASQNSSHFEVNTETGIQGVYAEIQ